MNIGWADRTICALTAVCEETDSEARNWIIHTIFNRAAFNPARFGSTPGAVCMKRYQFSEYLPDGGDNANVERALALPADSKDVADALATYDMVASGEIDPTGSATHFYSDSIPAPSWTIGATCTGRKGSALFFTNVK